MTQAELNDIKMADLPSALTRETLMEGYWYLIPEAAINCKKLHAAGIKKATDLRAACDNTAVLNKLTTTTGIAEKYLKGLHGILNFNRFKPIPLKKIETIEPTFLESFQKLGIKDTGALLLSGTTKAARIKLAANAKVPPGDLENLLRLADLMRLPGVKNIRARLYLESGIDCVEKFGRQKPAKLHAYLLEYTSRVKYAKAPPLPKELATTIAWAKILPIIVKFQ